MALQDNIVAAWFADALDLDSPTANITRSNPAGASDPSLSNGKATFDAANPNGILYTQTTGDFLTGGTADLTIAVRAKITISKSQDNIILHIGDSGQFDRALVVKQDSSEVQNFRLEDPSSGKRIENATGVTLDTFFTLVFRRSGQVWSAWLNGVQDDGAQNLSGSRDFNDALDDITVGVFQDGADGLDGAVDWFVVWDEAIPDADIQNSMDEATLKSALGLGGDSTPPTYDTAPALDSVSGRDITVDATASDETDSTVDHYAVVLAEGATAPSGQQIKDGNDSGGSAAIDSGSSLGVSNGVEASITLTADADDTAFDVFWTVEDDAGNFATVQKVDATTDPAVITALKTTTGFGFGLLE